MPQIIFIMLGFIIGYLFARMSAQKGSIDNIEGDFGLNTDPHADTDISSNVVDLPGGTEVKGVAIAGVFSGHLAPIRWDAHKTSTPATLEPKKSKKAAPRKKAAGGGKSLIQKQREEKQRRLDQAMSHFNDNPRASNDEIQKLLGVSDATATRYLQELERAGHIVQMGTEGKKVHYERVK